MPITLLPVLRPLAAVEALIDKDIDRLGHELAVLLQLLDQRNVNKVKFSPDDEVLKAVELSDGHLARARQQLTDGLLSARHALYSHIESL